MTKWALIDDNKIQQISDVNPSSLGLNHPGLTWIECGDSDVVGSVFHSANNAFTAPVVDDTPPNVPSPVYRIVLSPIEFKLQFTVQERLTLNAARNPTANANAQLWEIKAVLDDFFDLIDDPRLKEIHLNHAAVTTGASYLVSIGVLTSDRANTILQGIID